MSNYTKIVPTNPLKQWQSIVLEDLQVYTKNPVYILAGRFKAYPLRIFSQNCTGSNDKLIAYLIEADNVKGKLLVFFTFEDICCMFTDYSIKRNGYFCQELSKLLVLSLLARIKKGKKYNVSSILLPTNK